LTDLAPENRSETANFGVRFLSETIAIINVLDTNAIEKLATELGALRKRKGRLFILGVGGSAAHASHAVNDFRKLCAIEAYAPTDNVSELTARTNDEGWETTFCEWLRISRLDEADALLVLSVGGGNLECNVSINIVKAIQLARDVRAKVLGIVGRDGGYTARMADAAVLIPPLYPEHITPHTEGLAAVVWHLLVSHPLVQRSPTKWESVVSSNSAR
jgi:D-sedoheptulose 7-phosphate isomerase